MNRSFGAKESIKSKKHYKHLTKAVPLIVGGSIYPPQNIEDQYTVGICTAIDLTNMAGKVYGKTYSADFHYYIQKFYFDDNMEEGSSNYSSLRVGANYGFLPQELFPYIDPVKDRQLPYADYIAKLEAIPHQTILDLLTKCEHKLTGYAQVNPDITSMSSAVDESVAGIMCMYRVDNAWWTNVQGINSYDPAQIDPIRPPKTIIDGHSIKATYFDFTKSSWLLHANTWGTDYDLQGNCHVGYLPVECWIPYWDTNTKYIFNNNFGLRTRSIDVKQLQIRLGMPVQYQTGYFGAITFGYVVAYQIKNKILPTGYVGVLTRASLNG